MIRIFTCILFSCLIYMDLRGQHIPGDSLKREITLNEVCIYDSTKIKNEAFDFYKNNKLATIEDILSRMQGVNLIKRGAYGLEPNLRSYNSGQTNLTIGGMRIYGACTDKMDPVSIYVEPTNLSSIQVAHGATGAMNGSTIGGQINMQLKEPTFNCHSKVNGQISQTYLTVNNAYYASAALQQSVKKIAYRINGTYRKAGNYMVGGNLIVPYSGFEKYNFGGTVLFKLLGSQIIKFDYLGDWGKNIGYPALPMDVGKANAQIISLSHKLEIKNRWHSSNELKVYYNQITHQMDDTHRDNIPMHMDMPGWTETMGIYNEFNFSDHFNMRIDFHKLYARADMIMYPIGEPIMYLQTLPENNLMDGGIAASYNKSFKKSQKITVNGRIDNYMQSAVKGPGYKQWKVFNTDISKTLNDLLKNASIIYSKTFFNKINTQVTIGYGERLPTNNERYGYYLFNRQDQFDYIGNISLKAEKSYQMEFAIKHSYKFIDYSITVFYHQIKDLIYSYKLDGLSQMTIGAYGLKTYKNIDHAFNRGVEANLQIKTLDRITYIGTVKYIYTETLNGMPLPLTPPLKTQQALRYNYKLFQFQVEYDFAMKQDRVNSDYGDRITPSFHLFNLRGSKNFSVRSYIIQLTMACENIFDVRYREHLDIGQIPRYGRNFLINLNFMF